MKAQTDNAEHINDNRFSIFDILWVKSSNKKDQDALEPISIFRNFGEQEYALYKRSFLC